MKRKNSKLVRLKNRQTQQQKMNRIQKRKGIRPLRGRFNVWIRDLKP